MHGGAQRAGVHVERKQAKVRGAVGGEEVSGEDAATRRICRALSNDMPKARQCTVQGFGLAPVSPHETPQARCSGSFAVVFAFARGGLAHDPTEKARMHSLQH